MTSNTTHRLSPTARSASRGRIARAALRGAAVAASSVVLAVTGTVLGGQAASAASGWGSPLDLNRDGYRESYVRYDNSGRPLEMWSDLNKNARLDTYVRNMSSASQQIWMNAIHEDGTWDALVVGNMVYSNLSHDSGWTVSAYGYRWRSASHQYSIVGPANGSMYNFFSQLAGATGSVV